MRIKFRLGSDKSGPNLTLFPDWSHKNWTNLDFVVNCIVLKLHFCKLLLSQHTRKMWHFRVFFHNFMKKRPFQRNPDQIRTSLLKKVRIRTRVCNSRPK